MDDAWSRTHDVFEMLGAVGSAGAAIVAVWLAAHERSGRKLAEQERDKALRAQLTETREANARSVAVWFSFDLRVRHDPTQTLLVMSLANFGSQPIFPGRILLAGSGKSIQIQLENRGAVLGGQTLKNELTVPADWMKATSAYRERDPAPEHIYEMRQGIPLSGIRAGLSEITAIGCSFRDVQGVQWHRYADGTLSEAAQDSNFAGVSANDTTSAGEPSRQLADRLRHWRSLFGRRWTRFER